MSDHDGAALDDVLDDGPVDRFPASPGSISHRLRQVPVARRRAIWEYLDRRVPELAEPWPESLHRALDEAFAGAATRAA